MVKKLLEIACFKPEHVKLAATAGADRIEYCDQYALGGITPAITGFETLKKACSVPIYVMIRCRGGDFVYNNAEIKKMEEQLNAFKNAGADGVVFGTLLPNRRIDLLALDKLASAAAPLPYTFHRAFDLLREAEAGIDTLAEHNCSNILSSGGATNALQGAVKLNQYTAYAGNRLRIMAGGGIRAENAIQVLQLAPGIDLHSAALLNQHTFSMREVTELKNAMQHDRIV
jgi:copper homeostasis protein